MTEKDFFNQYCTQLNNQQSEAVRTIDGPVLLLAVPGSGKTTVLVHRLGYMLMVKDINPSNILTLTYTVAATKDMSERFKSIFGDEYQNCLEFRTINGICAKIIAHYSRLIGKTSFELITDDKESGKILTEIYVKVMKDYPTESDIKTVRTLITYCKNMCLTPKEIEEIGQKENLDLLKIFESYNSELKSRSLMDYDDQMIYAYRMLSISDELLSFYRDKYKYICVDEAQDTSKIQHMIISLLAGERGNLFMVGDEDQSIYGFRAAFPDALINFEKDHPGARVLVMDKNYRSNANIVKAADIFIQNNKSRHEKHIFATRNAGSSINIISLSSRDTQYNYLLKMALDCKEPTAVLYRDNESVLPLVDKLERNNVPYRIRACDLSFFTNRVVMDITNILRFSFNPADPELFLKIYYKFNAYLRKNDAEQMCYIADSKHIGILDAAEYLDLHKRVLGNCRSLRTHFSNMAKEPPYKAINRIVKFMGYGEYLSNNSIDDNKVFILKMLAKNETTINGFLERLLELSDILANKPGDYSSNFILSTIHSSKGLEYDNVVLMDAFNGLFPSKVIKSTSKASDQEKRDFEEERRIFYVGVTRAKNKLSILSYDDKPSLFINELLGQKINHETEETVKSSSKKTRSKAVNSDVLKTYTKKSVSKEAFSTASKTSATTKSKSVKVPDQLIIGERVTQNKYGTGTITDVSYDDDEIPTKFSVEFDSGVERKFIYPFAFNMGMKVCK